MRLSAVSTAVAGALALLLCGCASTTQSAAPGGGTGTAISPTGAPSGSGTGSGGISSGGVTTGPSMGGTASSPQPTSSVAVAAASHCPMPPDTPQNNPAAKPLPAKLPVVWVLRCRIVQGTAVGKGLLVAERSTSDTAALLRALRAPSVPRQKIVCPLLAIYLPNFGLVEPDGTVLIPKLPTNNCGMVQTDVVTALNRMTFVQISSRPVQ